MELTKRIELCREQCLEVLASGELAAVNAALDHKGLSSESLLSLLSAGTGHAPAADLLRLRDELASGGQLAMDRYVFERAMLTKAALGALDSINDLPVHRSVKHLFCREFEFYSRPPEQSLQQFDLGRYPFVAMSKVVRLKCFPAGEHQWEMSGFPRSWLAKVPAKLIPRTLAFLLGKAGGFRPFFESHLTSTIHKSLVLIEREFMFSFYRMARSLERNPQVRGIFAAGWLHCQETHRVNPYLAFMNRPFFEAGGIVVNVGPIEPNAGFLQGNKKRAELYRSGEYKPTTGVALCSREQAIAWAKEHAELEEPVNKASRRGFLAVKDDMPSTANCR